MKHEHDGARPRLAVSLDEAQRRDVVRLAAERSLRESRPVSMAEVVRDALRRGLAEGPEHAA